MRSARPKVLHEIAGRSLLGHVLAAVREAGASRTSIAVGTAPLVAVSIALVFLDEPVRAPLLLGALAIVVLVWFLRGRVKGRGVFPVAAAVLLPGAVANLLDGITALRHESLPARSAVLAPRNVAAVVAAFGHPLSGAALKLGNVVDFFSLWAAVLMAFGVVAVGEVPTRRALIGTLCAWLCYRLVVAVALSGGT
jgi:hypothetical protein